MVFQYIWSQGNEFFVEVDEDYIQVRIWCCEGFSTFWRCEVVSSMKVAVGIQSMLQHPSLCWASSRTQGELKPLDRHLWEPCVKDFSFQDYLWNYSQAPQETYISVSEVPSSRNNKVFGEETFIIHFLCTDPRAGWFQSHGSQCTGSTALEVQFLIPFCGQIWKWTIPCFTMLYHLIPPTGTFSWAQLSKWQ